MRFEQIAPSSIAFGLRAPSRIDDVLEDHCREHPVDHRSRSRASQELLQFSGHPVAGAGVVLKRRARLH
jgi:hypothetical protein